MIMTAEQLPSQSIAARSDQPLAAIFVADDSDEVRYVFDDPTAPATEPSADVQAALSVIGAWSDLHWEARADDLHRIRHESPPPPPIDLGDL